MNSDQDALDAWRIYAPRFQLILEAGEGIYEVSAHDEAHRRWYTIAREEDPASAMLAGCAAVSGQTPDDVAHLEIRSVEGEP